MKRKKFLGLERRVGETRLCRGSDWGRGCCAGREESFPPLLLEAKVASERLNPLLPLVEKAVPLHRQLSLQYNKPHHIS